MEIRHFVGGGCAALIVGIMSSNAHAALLGLTTKEPDVFSDTINIVYTVNSGVGTLTATGSSRAITQGATTNLVAPGTFQLTAVFTPTGSGSGNAPTIVSGSLQITGDKGSGMQTLLSSSSLSAFGFSTAQPEFEFVFASGSGALDPLAGNIELKLHGISVIGSTDYKNDYFGGNFGSPTAAPLGTSDAWPVPEPASLGVLALGGVGLLARRRRA